MQRKDGTIYDGKVINLTDVPDEKKKGRLTIRSNGISLYYDYTEHDKVQDVYDALDESAIYCNGDNGVFRLKFLSSPSTLLAYQPIFAEFGTNPSFELVATLKGGGKRAKGVQGQGDGIGSVKDIKGEITKGLVHLKNYSNPPSVVVEIIASIEKLVQDTKESPKDVASSLFQSVSKKQLSTILAGAINSSTRPQTRIKFIAEVALPELHEQLEELGQMQKTAIETIQNGIQLALATEFSEPSGQISWMALMKVLAEIISKEESPVADNAGGCTLS